MKTDKILRVKLTTYRRLRQQFKAQRGETMESYFKRLSKWLERVNVEWSGFV